MEWTHTGRKGMAIGHWAKRHERRSRKRNETRQEISYYSTAECIPCGCVTRSLCKVETAAAAAATGSPTTILLLFYCSEGISPSFHVKQKCSRRIQYP